IVGGSLPILAKKLKLDPAIMATPLITTIVDAVTVLIYFSISLSLLSI
ncbi:MAG: magnesium transporter, partial [Clostridia bacterium]|nr:magnesium transporter [Clostridia bacterium]